MKNINGLCYTDCAATGMVPCGEFACAKSEAACNKGFKALNEKGLTGGIHKLSRLGKKNNSAKKLFTPSIAVQEALNRVGIKTLAGGARYTRNYTNSTTVRAKALKIA